MPTVRLRAALWVKPKELRFNVDSAAPETECVWWWTDTVCPTTEQLLDEDDAQANEHLPPMELLTRHREAFRKGLKRDQLRRRQPVVTSGADYSRVLIYDANPSTSTLCSISIVVRNRMIDTRHVGSDGMSADLMRTKVEDVIRSHREDLGDLHTTSFVLGAVLAIPVTDIEGMIDRREDEVLDLEELVFSRRPKLAGRIRRKTAVARQELSTYGKLLGGYRRVCHEIISEYAGAFRGERDSGCEDHERRTSGTVREECHRYIGDLATRIDGALAKVSQLRETIHAIDDYLADSEAESSNGMLKWLSFVLLPATLVVGIFGMNFDVPGDSSSGELSGILTFARSILDGNLDGAIALLGKSGGFWPAVGAMLLFIPAVLILYGLFRVAHFLVALLGEANFWRTRGARKGVKGPR